MGVKTHCERVSWIQFLVLRDVWDYLRVEFRFVCGFEAIVICIKTASPHGVLETYGIGDL